MANQKEHYRQNAYVHGSAVPKLSPQHDYRNERIRRENEVQKRQIKRVVKRNQEKAMVMNRGYVLFLTAAVVISCLCAAFYINLQADVTQRMKQISGLESQVSSLEISNQETQKRIATSVDLNHIKDVAINQFGMVNPQANQIVYYDVKANDYMNQYNDIPSK